MKNHRLKGYSILIVIVVLILLVNFSFTGVTAPIFTKNTIINDIVDLWDSVPTDADNDGDMDLVVVGLTDVGGQGRTYIFKNDNMVFTKYYIDYDVGAVKVACADFDVDGYDEVVTANLVGDEINFYRSGGNPFIENWTRTIVVSGWDASYVVRIADIDKDGDLDIVGIAPYAHAISWFENINGDESVWTARTIITSFTGARGLDVIDIDNDGWLDVVGGAGDPSADDMAWFKNDGTPGNGAWAEYMIDSNVGAPNGIYCADINGDGYNDVVCAAQRSGPTGDIVAWWENDHTPAVGEWVQYNLDTSFIEARDVFAADVDADGDIDIMACALVSDEVAWWDNVDGSGTDWIKYSLATDMPVANDVYAFDLDMDGAMDIICNAEMDYVHGELRWYEQEQTEASFISINGGLNGTTVYNSTPTFNWTIVSTASKYWLQISTDNTFTSLVVNISDINVYNYPFEYSENSTRVSFTLPVSIQLPFFDVYYCRIKSLR